VPDVEQPDDPSQAGARPKIVVHELPITCPGPLAGSGETVTWQVDKVEAGKPIEVEQGRLAWRATDAGQTRPPREHVQQARLANVGPANEGNFRHTRLDRDLRIRKRSDKLHRTGGEWISSRMCKGRMLIRPGLRPLCLAAVLSRFRHASRLVRARSVTISGDVPSLIASLVITISRTSSRLGRSNMMSVIMVSRMARSPRAPVPRLRARWATARRDSGSNVRPTSSNSNNFRYCLVSAFLGSTRMRISASSS